MVRHGLQGITGQDGSYLAELLLSKVRAALSEGGRGDGGVG
jgi:GDP-D-mannose dehydratase